MCTGHLVHWYRYTMSKRTVNEWPGQGGGCGECVRIYWCEPRAASREPRAASREPRAASREPRAASCEPRAVSRVRERAARPGRGRSARARDCIGVPISYEQQ